MKFLITGAQFGNKGAQSLLACSVNEIRNKYSNAEIFFSPVDSIVGYFNVDLNVSVVYDDEFVRDSRIGLRKVYRYYQHVQNLRRLNQKHMKVLFLSDMWKDMDCVIDVSGFSLSTKWPIEINNRLLRYINRAKNNNVPIYLMPQSFGPFEKISHNLKKSILKTIPKANILFAREKEGAEALKDIVGDRLENILLSPDVVLCTEEPIPDVLFKNYHNRQINICTKNNVGIIPNIQLFVNCSEKKVLDLYDQIIYQLVHINKNIYIFRHSSDLDLCKKIYERHKANKKVFLVDDEFNCFEFSAFLKHFEFVIASRYHAVVHAYKNRIPTIILGWAVKYNELAKLFGQEKFVFSVDEEGANINDIVGAIREMNCNVESQRERIISTMTEVRKTSCFQKVWQSLECKTCDEG